MDLRDNSDTKCPSCCGENEIKPSSSLYEDIAAGLREAIAFERGELKANVTYLEKKSLNKT